MKTLQSSHLNRVHYEADSGVLTVEFVNGSTYKYPEVEFGDYYHLMKATSPGSYFLKNIKPKYTGVKITK